ncbi:exported hypothetical protein [Candidatus Methylobacter favarea]|uniref:Uncharacterized protein n=1 Tax=Candidatus Methylobacter favarea TaxID=2707345 RepID=A0A8S0XHW8_9GAMM|nr:hypothetical protein [Candidatus Methylobacter favarea]CAA9890093.1 exported hypothetical protein [Candidatus Methylobacter favarea]
MNRLYLVFIGSLFASFNVFADVQGIRNNPDSKAVPPLAPSAQDYKNAKGELPTVDSVPPSAYDNNVPPTRATRKGIEGQAPSVKYKGKPAKLYDSEAPAQQKTMQKK